MAALPMVTLMVRAPLRAFRRIGTRNVPSLLTRVVLCAMTFLPRMIATVTLPVLAFERPVTAKRESLPARSVAGALAVSAGASAAAVSAALGAVVDFGVAELLVLLLLGAALAGALSAAGDA